MAILSVNVNKLATLRNARGGQNPNVLQWVENIVSFGARGITIHPRPDERHITTEDTYQIGAWIHQYNTKNPTQSVEYNIEGYPDDRYIKLIKDTAPHQATLVPDPPDVLTSNAGWKLQENQDFLISTLSTLRELNCRGSLFIDVFKMDRYELEALKIIAPDRVELYTEAYAKSFYKKRDEPILATYKQAYDSIAALGIGFNAGHDLDQINLKTLVSALPGIKEVSIGHALICEALEEGMEKTVKNYLKLLKPTELGT